MPRPVGLSLDLLRTFITLVERDGDAARAAEQLGINQPSMSKRLGYLQHAGRVLEHPWLVRIGKTWGLTDEGRKILPAVRDLLRRYEQLTGFIALPPEGPAQVSFACGREAAAGFVRQAVRRFRRSHPGVRLRLSTLRGRQRIEGVANGALDLATVTHDPAAVYEIAHRPLHVEPLGQDRLALVCAADAVWSARVRRLPKEQVTAEMLLDLPLILPEPDAGIRKGLDAVLREAGLLGKLDVVMETGGWGVILVYVREGLGVGLVSEAALADDEGLVVRHLVPGTFPPILTRLICRRSQGTGKELDLTADAAAFAEALRKAARSRGE